MQRAIAEVLAQVNRTIRQYRLLAAGDRILVAVSGGPDSVGLLAVLAALRRKLGIDLVAAHVNHRLRGRDADADEACASAVAARLQVAFVRCELPDTLGRGGNIEARARALRYAALHRLADEHGSSRIATGHTQDDQAETVLLRLIRGAASRGLSAIQPRRRDGVIRPLIDCSRVQIEAVALHFRLPYRVDSSNRDPRFARTRIRFEVLPLLSQLNPRVVASLARSAALCRAEAEVVSAWAGARVDEIVQNGELDLVALRTVPSALQGHVTRAWLERQGLRTGLSERHVRSVLRLARGHRPGGTVALPRGQGVRRRYDRLIACAPPRQGATAAFEPRELSAGEEVSIPGWRISAGPVQKLPGSDVPRPPDLWSAVCDAGGVEFPLIIRPARRGDRVRPLRLRGTRKLSDVFTDRKVPAADRWVYPLVMYREDVVWVPGVVRCEALRLRPESRDFLRLWARQEE